MKYKIIIIFFLVSSIFNRNKKIVNKIHKLYNNFLIYIKKHNYKEHKLRLSLKKLQLLNKLLLQPKQKNKHTARKLFFKKIINAVANIAKPVASIATNIISNNNINNNSNNNEISNNKKDLFNDYNKNLLQDFNMMKIKIDKLKNRLRNKKEILKANFDEINSKVDSILKIHNKF